MVDVVPLAFPLTNLGIVYEKQAKLQKAKAVFRKSVKRYRDDPAAHQAYCRFGATLLNRKITGTVPNNELLRVCKRVTELEPENVDAYATWGSVYVGNRPCSQPPLTVNASPAHKHTH